MQTFMPYGSDFAASAIALDNQRLGKQRVECLQIINTLTGRSEGWKNHPAVLMWDGYEDALVWYSLVVCQEWRMRGFQDTCDQKIRDAAGGLWRTHIPNMFTWDWEPINWWCGPCRHEPKLPYWLDGGVLEREMIVSHRHKLWSKDPEHYSQWKVLPEREYFWPKSVWDITAINDTAPPDHTVTTLMIGWRETVQRQRNTAILAWRHRMGVYA